MFPTGTYGDSSLGTPSLKTILADIKEEIIEQAKGENCRGVYAWISYRVAPFFCTENGSTPKIFGYQALSGTGSH